MKNYQQAIMKAWVPIIGQQVSAPNRKLKADWSHDDYLFKIYCPDCKQEIPVFRSIGDFFSVDGVRHLVPKNPVKYQLCRELNSLTADDEKGIRFKIMQSIEKHNMLEQFNDYYSKQENAF